jgi:RNA polymerase sigma factor (sigma-70 family)
MWKMRATSTNETSLVVAAQAGDPRALDELVTANLPLVYTIVRRALGAGPDVDDVVQETLLRAVRELRTLRTPERFRSWLVTIAIRQVSTHLYRRDLADDRTVALEEAAEVPDAEFEGPTLLHLELSGQRRQVVRASRWLDPDDRALLSLWWLEVAGRLTRAELAAALGMRVPHAGVRVQRMRNQLDVSRSLVAALDAGFRCAGLTAALTGWNGVPSPLWRKRLARHTRSCPVCTRAADDLVPPERLLAGLAFLPVPVALSAAVVGKSALAGTTASAASAAALSGASGSGAVSAGGKAGGLLAHLAQVFGAHPVATAVAGSTLAVGAAVSTAAVPTFSPAPEVIAAPVVVPSTSVPTASAPSPTPPSPASPTFAGPSNTGSRSLPLGPVSLESVNEAGLVVTTADDLGVLRRVDANSDGAARVGATFEVVRGLADARCVAFRAEDGRYLRHSSWRLRLSADEGTELFRGDATFCVYAGSVPGSVSLRSSNYPHASLRHRGAEVWLDPADDSAAFRADASFRPRQPLAR